MDLSLKQRLLGAAVVIALAIIFIPMFMSSSSPQKTGEMETSTLAIPPAPPDRDFQTRELPVEPPKPETPPSAAPADEGRVATVDTATASKSESEPASTPAATATPAAPPKPEPESTPAATPAPAAPAKPESTPPSTPAKTGTSKKAAKAAAATTTPAAESNPASAPGQAANGHYFVYLGAYAVSKNANDLVANLKTGGFPAFAETTQYQGKPATRVRVGPFESRAAAESTRLRIKKIKPTVPGSVIQTAEDAKADAPPAALPANRAGGWAVQLGALKTVEDANKLRDRLRGAGFMSFVDKAIVNGATFWRVRAGPEANRGAADKLRAGIRDKLKLDGVLVTQP